MSTDTNRFIYKIETENVYEDLYNDFSKYSKESKYHKTTVSCCKIIDETCGVPIKSIVLLKAKVDTFSTDFQDGPKKDTKKRKKMKVILNITK